MDIKQQNTKKYLFSLFLLNLAALFITGCQADTAEITKSSFMLNTVVQITLYGEENEVLIDEALALCKVFEERFSRTISTSDISRMNNRSKDTQSFDLDADLAEILQKSLYYSELSGGRFDVTLEPVTNLWDFTADPFVLPSDDKIKEKISYVDYRNIVIENHQITFLSPDTKIDLGAIAKGYITDKIKEFLISRGVTSGIINLGGNVLCIGNKPDGRPFKIGLQKPFEERSETVSILSISDFTVVSSGVYERNKIIDGINYHHLLDPETGYPVDNDLISVTIITKNSVDGDGLSTTCFVMGLEKGLELINSIPDTYAVFITSDGELHYSNDAADLVAE